MKCASCNQEFHELNLDHGYCRTCLKRGRSIASNQARAAEKRSLLVTVLIVIGIIVTLLLLSIKVANGQQIRSSAPLEWNYPFANVSPELAFIIRTNNNLSTTNWGISKFTYATNCLKIQVGGPTNTYGVNIGVSNTQTFIVCQASNWWGVSPFSNVTNTPPGLVSDVNLRLGP
jgi:hypothetical protein